MQINEFFKPLQDVTILTNKLDCFVHTKGIDSQETVDAFRALEQRIITYISYEEGSFHTVEGVIAATLEIIKSQINKDFLLGILKNRIKKVIALAMRHTIVQFTTAFQFYVYNSSSSIKSQRKAHAEEDEFEVVKQFHKIIKRVLYYMDGNRGMMPLNELIYLPKSGENIRQKVNHELVKLIYVRCQLMMALNVQPPCLHLQRKEADEVLEKMANLKAHFRILYLKFVTAKGNRRKGYERELNSLVTEWKELLQIYKEMGKKEKGDDTFGLKDLLLEKVTLEEFILKEKEALDASLLNPCPIGNVKNVQEERKQSDQLPGQ